MEPTDDQSSNNSLYNEDRNLLRIREKERRNQEALQEKDKFPEKTPLFAEPYKTTKEDELSNRIQNMLGNYEEVKELISNKSHQNLIGIPKSVAPLIPQGKPDRPYFPEKTSHTLPSSFHRTTHHPPMGPTAVAPPPPSHSVHYQKAQSRTEAASGLHTKSHSVSNGQSQGQEHNRGGQESHAGFHHKRNDRHAVGEGHANELQPSILARSPLLSPVSSPVAPPSPLHSSQHSNSRSQNSSKSHGPTHSQKKSSQDLVTGSQEKESQDSSAVTLTSTTQPSSQTFPPPLPSKTSAMQQKPTAYVRPMDGQDQAPAESPELKPLLEEYHGEPDEKILDLKANTKAKLSKLEIPSEPVEQTFPSDVQSIEEILKEMTHSWPPPLTAIHTPSTAEPSKFPFPAKESQHVGCVAQNQKQYDAPSKALPSSLPRTSTLQDDLQLSDSEESGDDQVVEKPPSSLAPPSALQSQPKSVASAHSSSPESGSTSDSDSSSDSETESNSTDSEANNLPRASAPERQVEKEIDRKKMKPEKEKKSLQSSANEDSSKLKASKASFETQKKDLLLPPPLPPMSPAQPASKPTKMAQKRPRSETCELPAMDNTASNKSNHKDPLFSKHKKVERNHAELLKGIKGSAGDVTNPFPVPSLSNGTSKPRRPQLNFEKQHPTEYYIEEAKRLKHKADAMTDKTGKAFQYLDAALSFIEYGIALESDAPVPKSAYSIFSDTIDLIKFTMALKSFADSSASSHEKIFAVLCMRCQSILHMATFRYKKDTAIKYSRILNDHFKSSSRVTKAPSPCVARSTGMPSPLSPMPSPASSVTSQLGSNASNFSGNSIGSSVTVPYNIPSITSSYVNITSYILYAYDIWEQADALARKNKEFFAELSTATCALALNSSMTELVHYARQGLQWLRLETNMP
ncbi:AF4/FMR2 family member 1 isoform X3 [Phalacrocorax aristotelis]|uniref:AF4/FMR2 family member 1 isoform X3 n=1 Tax=Phalacrocorax aristotelis TaxID=126867 RepID=UPI003F4CAAED